MSFSTASRSYRKPITVGTGSAGIANFQKKIIVTYDSKMASDFSDLIFQTIDGDNIDYWIETKTNSTSASVWVKLPYVSSSMTTTIYMYYGASGTVSSPSDIDDVMDAGLRFFYYDGTGFNTYQGTGIDTSVSHGWGSGTVSIAGVGNQSDTCSIKWKGWVKPYGLGNTTFYTTSDDGQRLYVGGSLIINNWQDQGDTERSYTYNLQGIKTYEYQWYENGGGATARMGWDPVSGGKTYPIPSTYLRCCKYLSSEPSMTFGSEEAAIEATTNYLKRYRRSKMLGNLSGQGNVQGRYFPTDGLIHFWKFEDNLNDEVGNRNGTGSGIAYATGKNGKGLSLDATTDYVTISPIGNSTITIAGWYYYSTANSGSWNTVFCRNGGSRHHILINGDTRIIGFYNSAWYPSSLTLTTGNWYFIVCEKTGTNEKIYVNNNLVLNSNSSFDNFSGDGFGIIGNYTSSSPSQGARGIIDEVGVWNRALTSLEKTYLYNSGNGVSFDE